MEIRVVVDDLDGLKDAITQSVIAHVKNVTRQEWYSLEEAAALKGVNYETIRKDRSLQPNGGRGQKVGKRIRFHWTIVHEWLSVTDENREEYLRKCRGAVA
jgi:hypothetical protein